MGKKKEYFYSPVHTDGDEEAGDKKMAPMGISAPSSSSKSRRQKLRAPPSNYTGGSNFPSDSDDLVEKRMPMCLGLCVLLAIVYVLSRTSDVGAGGALTVDNCDYSNVDMGKIRAQAFAKSPPHIIECAEASAGGDQSACHLPRETRYAAVKQKGATLWMTGCSGSGKTTIATALEDKLVKTYGKHVYRLDGDNIRTGLNRDLGFSADDRAESVRRVGEISTLFSDAGVITLVGLISPYRADRDAVRKRHEDQGIPFYEVFLDVPIEELFDRDPKGQYAKVKSGELKHFTCIDDPYEEPLHPEITLATHQLKIEESVSILFERLRRDGILEGAPKLSPPGLPNPDGDQFIDLHVAESEMESKLAEAATLPKVLLTDVDLNWLQVIGEGWSSPLKGFMREGTLLETLHFNSMKVDPFNLTGNVGVHERQTEFNTFTDKPAPTRVSMSVPITLPITDFTKDAIERSNKKAVALVTQMGKTVAILRDPEIYDNFKEEIIARMFGVIDNGHPYIKLINGGGDYLLGGEVELLGRIRYNDGLDKWRKTAGELMNEFVDKGADVVYAFQTRNPTHAGHAYLMNAAGEDLKSKHHFKNPVLWLSPLGGWTKEDDVPLDVRIHQHEEVLKASTSHPGGLDPDKTVMAIWPSPMVYAGPTEVQFHAKSRRSAGASYFVVGRDPAGMKGSPEAVAHPNDDLYYGDHGRYVLRNSPGIGDMQILSFVKVMYDVKTNTMTKPDESRMEDFISISGTKMRALAKAQATPCPDKVPTDLLAENCVPNGFMVKKGWDIVTNYYSKRDDADSEWIPWSRPIVEPNNEKSTTEFSGRFGTAKFKLSLKDAGKSFWHDINLWDNEDRNVINMVTEIPKFTAAKMEVQKELSGNPIMQDVNSDGSARFYSYGVPFFNYGMIPQTWEDPDILDEEGHGGDDDPLDVIEIGSRVLKMGSITPCKVIGSLELIDGGETDHKVVCVAKGDEHYSKIHDAESLEDYYPGVLDDLITWLKRYKTSEGKGVNELGNRERMTDVTTAIQVIGDCHQAWKSLCGKGTHLFSLTGACV